MGIFAKKLQEIPLITFFIKSIIKILQIARKETGGVNQYVCISILGALLEQFPGKLDSFVLLFLKILCNELSNKDASKSYRLFCLQLAAYLFIYDSKLTIKNLTELGMLIPVCQNFFSSLRKYDDGDQIRVLIYGITCLIKTDVEFLPDIIKAGMPKILESLIKLCHRYTKNKERQMADELEDFLSSKDIPQDVHETKQGYLDKLNEYNKNEKEEEDEDDGIDDDDDYLWTKSDSNYYKSKLESLEAPLFLRDTLSSMHQEKRRIVQLVNFITNRCTKIIIREYNPKMRIY